MTDPQQPGADPYDPDDDPMPGDDPYTGQDPQPEYVADGDATCGEDAPADTPDE